MIFTPEPYQTQMEMHLLEREIAALFVGMGLGKTVASLNVIKELILECGGSKGALVVAPVNVNLLVWPQEVEKWDHLSWLKVMHMRDKEAQRAWFAGKPYIYLISWDSLQWMAEHILSKTSRSKCPVETVIYDELSRAKSHKSKRVRAHSRYRFLFDRHYGLTGTPTPNGYMDLFAQMRLLDGGTALGKSFTHFRKRFFQQDDYMGYKFSLKPGAKEEIEELITPYTLTLLSEDYLDIPPTDVEDCYVTLPVTARAFYDKLEKDMLAKIRDKEVDAATAAVLVNKLLQVTSGMVYNSDGEEVKIHNAKLVELNRLVKLHRGEPLLVVTMYNHERQRILDLFPNAVLFKGDGHHKKQLEAAWNRKEVPIIVSDPRSIGHGLNLQDGGRIIIWVSHTYSSEQMDQTNSRLARKGQKHRTLIYRIIANNTADEAVLAVQGAKVAGQKGLFAALKNIEILHKHGH